MWSEAAPHFPTHTLPGAAMVQHRATPRVIKGKTPPPQEFPVVPPADATEDDDQADDTPHPKKAKAAQKKETQPS